MVNELVNSGGFELDSLNFGGAPSSVSMITYSLFASPVLPM